MKNTKFKTNVLPPDSKNIFLTIGTSMEIKASHILRNSKVCTKYVKIKTYRLMIMKF